MRSSCEVPNLYQHPSNAAQAEEKNVVWRGHLLSYAIVYFCVYKQQLTKKTGKSKKEQKCV